MKMLDFHMFIFWKYFGSLKMSILKYMIYAKIFIICRYRKKFVNKTPPIQN